MHLFEGVRKWWVSGTTAGVDTPVPVVDVQPPLPAPLTPPVVEPARTPQEIARLIQEIDLVFIQILDDEERMAKEHAANPRWQSGRTNVGLDERDAVQVARYIDRSRFDQTDPVGYLTDLIEVLKERRERFRRYHPDEEGFGAATFMSIVRPLRAFGRSIGVTSREDPMEHLSWAEIGYRERRNLKKSPEELARLESIAELRHVPVPVQEGRPKKAARLPKVEPQLPDRFYARSVGTGGRRVSGRRRRRPLR